MASVNVKLEQFHFEIVFIMKPRPFAFYKIQPPVNLN